MLALVLAATIAQAERPYNLTPGAPDAPVLTGPMIVGTRPLSPATHWVTATGKGPIEFSATGLPPGYAVEAKTGRLTGSVGFPGSFRALVKAKNRFGEAERELRILVGDTLALTPPLQILLEVNDQAGVERAMEAANKSLRLHGWSTLILPPGARVGDPAQVREMAHGRGFRLGGFGAGLDVHYGTWDTPEALGRAAEAARNAGRDVLVGMANHISADQAGRFAGAHMRRFVGMLGAWPEVAEAWRSFDGWAPLARPGQWNDLGWLTVGPGSPFTPNECYSLMSIACLLASPLTIVGDPSAFDSFTLNLLTNQEVLAFSQDPLGTPARLTLATGEFEVWSKSLADGDMAVGIFNKGEKEASCTFEFVSVVGGIRLRDVWRQQKVGLKKNAAGFKIPRHGVRLLRVNKIAEFRLRLGPEAL